MGMKEIAKSGAGGNDRLLKQYGGSGSGERKAYADGGKVTAGDGPAMKAFGGGIAEGMPAKGRLDRPGKKIGKKPAHTNVNVIIGAKPDAAPMAPDAGGPMPGMPAMPMKPPMVPPPGIGGPPSAPPMLRKNGGRVKKADGGKVIDMDDGAGSGEGRLEKADKYGK